MGLFTRGKDQTNDVAACEIRWKPNAINGGRYWGDQSVETVRLAQPRSKMNNEVPLRNRQENYWMRRTRKEIAKNNRAVRWWKEALYINWTAFLVGCLWNPLRRRGAEQICRRHWMLWGDSCLQQRPVIQIC